MITHIWYKMDMGIGAKQGEKILEPLIKKGNIGTQYQKNYQKSVHNFHKTSSWISAAVQLSQELKSEWGS